MEKRRENWGVLNEFERFTAVNIDETNQNTTWLMSELLDINGQTSVWSSKVYGIIPKGKKTVIWNVDESVY